MKVPPAERANRIDEDTASPTYKRLSEVCDEVAPVDPGEKTKSLAMLMAVFWDRDRNMMGGISSFSGPAEMVVDAARSFVFLANHLLEDSDEPTRLGLEIKGVDEQLLDDESDKT